MEIVKRSCGCYFYKIKHEDEWKFLVRCKDQTGEKRAKQSPIEMGMDPEDFSKFYTNISVSLDGLKKLLSEITDFTALVFITNEVAKMEKIEWKK